MIHPIIPLGY